MANAPSDKSRAVALALCIPLGVFGAHRFYVGKIGTGLLQLCTLGGFGLWYLYDLITIASGEFRDGNDRRVSLWDPEDSNALTHGVPQELMDEIESLRHEVSELAERLDFTERLLADPTRRPAPPGQSAS
jgi:TM2 domain-containing membrane protein YozV